MRQKVLAVVTLVTMLAPYWPSSALAQSAAPEPSVQESVTPSTIPLQEPDISVNASPEITPEIPEPTTSPSPESLTMPTEDSNAPGPSESPATESMIDADEAPAKNETFNQGRPLPAEVNTNTGGLNYSYPIAVPPGRNKLQPNLQLNYSTDDRNPRSQFGNGWSINIPYIERLNKYGVENLYDNSTSSKYFYSSMDGELATTTVASTYTARVENGIFNSYVFANNQWTMRDKSGTQYVYGSATSSRMDDPNDSTRVYRWMLREVRDTNDNYIAYSHYKDNGEIYPSTISYTGHSSTDGIFEIDFLRESRSDTGTTTVFQSGFAVSTRYRINEIDAKVNGRLVHKYLLAYTTGSNGSTSLLRSITETGYDESSNPTSLPATTFTYQSNTPNWVSDSTWNLPVAIHSSSSGDLGYKFADVNGDSLPDLLGNDASYVNNGHGWTSDPTWLSPVDFSTNGHENGYRLIDVNGDRLADIVRALAPKKEVQELR